MDKKLKPDVFWAINSNEYDTYMVSSTDRISFKCEDLYRFMEDYAQLRLSAVIQQSEQSSKIIDGECMICGDVSDTKDGWICGDCRRSE